MSALARFRWSGPALVLRCSATPSKSNPAIVYYRAELHGIGVVLRAVFPSAEMYNAAKLLENGDAAVEGVVGKGFEGENQFEVTAIKKLV